MNSTCSLSLVFDTDQAKKAKAGLTNWYAHVGLTTRESIGAAVALTLDDAIEKVMDIAKVGRKGSQDII